MALGVRVRRIEYYYRCRFRGSQGLVNVVSKEISDFILKYLYMFNTNYKKIILAIFQ